MKTKTIEQKVREHGDGTAQTEQTRCEYRKLCSCSNYDCNPDTCLFIGDFYRKIKEQPK